MVKILRVLCVLLFVCGCTSEKEQKPYTTKNDLLEADFYAYLLSESMRETLKVEEEIHLGQPLCRKLDSGRTEYSPLQVRYRDSSGAALIEIMIEPSNTYFNHPYVEGRLIKSSGLPAATLFHGEVESYEEGQTIVARIVDVHDLEVTVFMHQALAQEISLETIIENLEIFGSPDRNPWAGHCG